MKTTLILFSLTTLLFTIVSTFSGCQSSQQKMENFAKEVNQMCPYNIEGGVILEEVVPLAEKTIRLDIKLPEEKKDTSHYEPQQSITDEILTALFAQKLRESKSFAALYKINTTVVLSIMMDDNLSVKEITLLPETYKNKDINIDNVNWDRSSYYETIDMLLSTNARLFNMNTPIKDSDDGITVESFEAENNSLIVNYSVTKSLWKNESEKNKIIRLFKSRMINEIKNSYSYLYLIENGIVVKVKFYDKTQNDSFEFSVFKKDIFPL